VDDDHSSHSERGTQRLGLSGRLFGRGAQTACRAGLIKGRAPELVSLAGERGLSCLGRIPGRHHLLDSSHRQKQAVRNFWKLNEPILFIEIRGSLIFCVHDHRSGDN